MLVCRVRSKPWDDACSRCGPDRTVALALLVLTDGDPNAPALMAANVGRDADTIGTMGCAVVAESVDQAINRCGERLATAAPTPPPWLPSPWRGA